MHALRPVLSLSSPFPRSMSPYCTFLAQRYNNNSDIHLHRQNNNDEHEPLCILQAERREPDKKNNKNGSPNQRPIKMFPQLRNPPALYVGECGKLSAGNSYFSCLAWYVHGLDLPLFFFRVVCTLFSDKAPARRTTPRGPVEYRGPRTYHLDFGLFLLRR